jgi:galactonate dehydratase
MLEEIVNHDGSKLTDDGYILLRDVPGIGVEINEDARRKYAAEGVPFSE